jgi:hypothetical protein
MLMHVPFQQHTVMLGPVGANTSQRSQSLSRTSMVQRSSRKAATSHAVSMHLKCTQRLHQQDTNRCQPEGLVITTFMLRAAREGSATRSRRKTRSPSADLYGTQFRNVVSPQPCHSFLLLLLFPWAAYRPAKMMFKSLIRRKKHNQTQRFPPLHTSQTHLQVLTGSSAPGTHSSATPNGP